MKVLKTLLTVVLVVGVLGAAAYGGGFLIRHHDQTRASASPGTSRPQAGPTRAAPPAPTTDPSAGPSAGPSATPSASLSTHPTRQAPAAVLEPGANGTGVRELQQRLFQLAWLPETTTGAYDDPTVAAVKGFQTKHGLRSTGVLDRRTWDRLVAMTRKPSHDAMFNVLHPGRALLGSGDTGPDVRAIQARLKQIDWYFGDVNGRYDGQTVTAVKGFQAKRVIPVTGDVDQRTLDRLTAMTTAPTD